MQRQLVRRRRWLLVGLAVATSTLVSAADKKTGRGKPAKTDRVFSGPQVGEVLPKFSMLRMFGEDPDETFDPIAAADGKPVVVVFVHKLSRPGIAVTRTVARFLGQKKKSGIGGAVVFLTEDPTKTAAWMRRARRALPGEIPLGISGDGIEGPGAYGLNRKVELTVLVGNKGKVTANFALVQPSTAVDVPGILKAIVAQVGGKVPTLASLGVAPRRTRGGLPPDIATKVRQLIQKTAKPADVDKTAEELETIFAKRPAVGKQVGQIGRRIIGSGRLKTYGTPSAQAYLKKWADKYAPARKSQPDSPSPRARRPAKARQ